MKNIFLIAALFCFYNCNAQVKKRNKPIQKVATPVSNKVACGDDNNIISFKKKIIGNLIVTMMGNKVIII
jgi:hypothetical protein